MLSQHFSHSKKNQRTGVDLLRDPLLNRGLSFSAKERKDLKVAGLMPALVDCDSSSEGCYQERLCMKRLQTLPNNLDKFDYLMRIYDTDKVAFFRIISRNVQELMPLVYTPTIGLACENYDLVHCNGRGLFIPITEAGNITSILENWPIKDVRVIVVTDGERVLKLGDLGAYGMGIAVGKLVLCTALAGISPENCLPVVLDVGTNNQKLLDDPLYFGVRAERATGDAYDNFVAEFMQSCTKVFGKDVLIQFEDFSNQTALRFQKKYAPQYCCFNDDIQGAASAILSGLLTASRKSGRKLQEETFVCFGAGKLMLGFARLLLEALKSLCSLNEREARSRIFMVDSRGLIVKNRAKGGISTEKAVFARPVGTPEMTDLKEIIKYCKCTSLIGASAVPNSFSSEAMSQLAEHCREPLIFALSTPTERAECTAEAAYKATKGQCLFASGNPSAPVTLEPNETPDNSKTCRKPGQANSSYILPGLVLSISALRIQPITDGDFIAAAEALSELVTDEELKDGCLYPSWDRIRSVSYKLACKVGHSAFKQGRCRLKRSGGGLKEDEIDNVIKGLACYPNASPDAEI
nr:unnamed protein product [Spirometra erinaceieuropaei]